MVTKANTTIQSVQLTYAYISSGYTTISQMTISIIPLKQGWGS